MQESHHLSTFNNSVIRYALLGGLIWTITLAGSLAWNITKEQQQNTELAKQAAIANFDKDQAFRLWGTSHGGVYVPPTERTPPNPYLAHIPDRDILSTKGKKLTLMNPAYMSRQMMEDYSELYGIKGRITGLVVLNPINTPDDWEKKALKSFQRGAKEAVELSKIDGKDYLRFMKPILMEKGCEKCHGHLGFKIGDIRGGVSVSIPMEPYRELEKTQLVIMSITHGGIWLLGVFSICFVFYRSRLRILSRGQVEKTLRKHTDFIEKVVSSSPIGIAIYDETGQCISTNDAFAKILGATNEEVLSQNYHDIESWKKSGLYEKTKCSIRENKKIQYEAELKSTFGNQINIDCYLVPFEQGRLLLMFVDILKQKQLEAMLRQSQKMEAIGLLTGGIAHEFNNLLSPILGYTDMLINKKSVNDLDRENLKQIKIAGNRAKNLVQQMLAYGRQSMSRSVLLQLEALVEDTLKLIKNTIPPNISVEKEIEANLPPILGMPDEIHQVILNLCINASYAMPDGGRLMIRLENEGYHKFLNSEGQTREGDFIGLSIGDTGFGMDQAILERIFDPFFTTKAVGEGSGLGLSVALGIIEQHQGHIKVDSVVGEGTTFHLYFPVSSGEVKTTPVKTKPLSQGNEKIMLIDDDLMIVNLTKRMLEQLGYKVTEFLDCDEALKLFAERPQDFDLVITDYGMSKMNGKQLAKKIKEIRPEIPTILFTSYVDLVAKEDINRWGFDGLLMKPFELNELSEVVRSVLPPELRQR